jgi:hypothetical protein
VTPDEYIQYLADQIAELERVAPKKTVIKPKGRRRSNRIKVGRSKYVRSLRQWERKQPKLKMRRAVISSLDRGRIY